MKNKDFNKLVELLKSGDFSIMYTNQGCCEVYKGKPSDDEFVEEYIIIDEDEGEYKEPAFELDSDYIGYMPTIVAALIEALGGRGETY